MDSEDPKHSELEVKFAADLNGTSTTALIDAFERLIDKDGLGSSVDTDGKIEVSGTDIYYKRGRDVVRQRIGHTEFPSNELTVKVRKSKKSIEDRHEVDLTFDKKTRPIDVQQFLKLTGWKEEVSLVKTNHIYFFKEKGWNGMRVDTPEKDQWWGFDVAIYDVTLSPPGLHESRRFVEIEIHKDGPMPMDARAHHLKLLSHSLKMGLGLGEPLNESLYEIYTGNKYRIQKG